MSRNKDDKERKAAVIAAAVTFVAALVILVLLFVLTVGDSRRALAESSVPEIQDEEEIFLEPDLLVVDDPGDESEQTVDEAAPQPPGEPDPAPEEKPVRVVRNPEAPKEKPVSNKAPLMADSKESDVKTSTPKLSKEEEQRIASMQGKLKTDNNGSRTGKESAESGNGGSGVGATGSLSGRRMLSCPTWKQSIPKAVVKVRITVNAEGSVTAASAVSGGNATVRGECEKMALRSKWTPKAGASPETGYITFNIAM